MTNPFKTYGINHLSASQLTTFTSDPSRWFAQKVLGYRSPSSAAMERGKAVESGIVAAITGTALADATEAALTEYDRATRFASIQGDIAAERENIGPMIAQAVPALERYGVPSFPEGGGQHKITIPVRFGPEEDQTIEILGYMDLVYDDCVIDVKSTMRIPSDMPFNHRIQAAIYARTSNKPVKFLYTSPKKTLFLEDSDTAASQRDVRAIVQRMAAFLSLSDDPEILKAAVPVIVDAFSWRCEEDARRRLFGL